jgi:hypothetical protein
MSAPADDVMVLAATLIAAWDRAGRQDDVALEGAAQFENLAMPRRPRGGLAIGRSINPATRKPRLEMRVTAKAGPNYVHAVKLADQAQAQGVEAVLKILKNAIIGGPVSTAPAAVGGRRRPLHIGASVANRKSMAGTLGAFLRLPDGAAGILSCGHVLARAGRKWGTVKNPVHQPGQPEENPVLESNRIGELTNMFAPFLDSQTNNLDAAVARLDEGQAHIGNTIIDLPCVPAEFRNRPIGAPLTPSGLELLGSRVVKLGRTTGFTEATITATDILNLRVRFGARLSGETFTFSGIYEVLWDTGTTFAAGGDSGSLVMTREGLRPIGLHFASVEGEDGSKVSYVVPWALISGAFNLPLW